MRLNGMKIFVGIFFLSCFHGLYAENECNDYQCEVLDPISYLEGALDWNKVDDVIEIGDHLGWSTRFLTNKLPLKSKIYLIGSEENEREILSNLGSQMSLNQVIFHSNDFIQEARKWSHRVSLIYFHVGIEEIYKNLKAWSPKVAVGGMMCGLSASSPLFLAQVKLFASQNQYSVKVKGDFWYLSPKKPSPFHRVRSCPWVVDHANDFLETFMENHPDARVLEFGSGSSTLWFAKRTPNLVSIEHQENWYELIQTYIETHDQYYPVEYYLHPLPYHSVCQKLPKESFDLIIVDGRNRKVCLRESISLLKPGGVLMLDNSERPYYHGAFSLFHGWKGQVFKQVGPDREGFHYPGWETRLWVKPELNPMRP